jgi:hypothetical protein
MRYRGDNERAELSLLPEATLKIANCNDGNDFVELNDELCPEAMDSVKAVLQEKKLSRQLTQESSSCYASFVRGRSLCGAARYTRIFRGEQHRLVV